MMDPYPLRGGYVVKRNKVIKDVLQRRKLYDW